MSSYVTEYACRTGRALPFVLRSGRRYLQARRAVRQLPVVQAAPSRTAEGAAVRRGLAMTPVSKLAFGPLRGVVQLSADPADYLAGSARATVRRKVRAAERAGIGWRLVVSYDEKMRLLDAANRYERHNERPEYRNAQPQNDDLLDMSLWLTATNRAGKDIMLVVLPVDRAWATLRYYRTLEATDDASLARYAMMPVVAEALVARGVRFLADTADPKWLPPGLRHFQRMVGFRLVRVQIR